MNLEELESAAVLAKELEYLKRVLDNIKKAEKVTFHVKIKFKAQLDGSVYHLAFEPKKIIELLEADIEATEDALGSFGVEV